MTEELTEKEKQIAHILEVIGPIDFIEIEEKTFREYLKKRKENNNGKISK